MPSYCVLHSGFDDKAIIYGVIILLFYFFGCCQSYPTEVWVFFFDHLMRATMKQYNKSSMKQHGSSGRVLSPPLELSGDSCVVDLINRDTGWWDSRKIDKCFLPFEAQNTKSMPLCSNPHSDYFFWPLAGDGIYTVKTGYKLLCDVSREEAASVSNSDSIKTFQSRLWKLKIPGKVKHFPWKERTNSLPTKCNLLKRKVLSDPTCHLCGNRAEDAMYALWECEAVKLVGGMDFGWVNDRSFDLLLRKLLVALKD